MSEWQIPQQGAYEAAPTPLTDGAQAPLAIDALKRLRLSPEDGVGDLLEQVSDIAHDVWHTRQESFTLRGELRVGAKTTLISASSDLPLSRVRDVWGGANGTTTKIDGEYRLATGAAASASQYLMTRHRGGYQCGLDGLMELSLRIPQAPVGEQKIEWGYYDGPAGDGYGFGQDAAGLYVWVLHAGEKIVTRQADWNQDRLDGTGHSGYAPVLSRGLITGIQFNWFGYGSIEFFVLAPAEGRRQHRIMIHRHQHTANRQHSRSARLPIRVDIANGATAQALEAYIGGRAFSLLGDYSPDQRIGGHVIGNWPINGTAGVPKYLMSVRHKDTGGFEAVRAIMNAFEVAANSRDVLVDMRIDCALTGAAWQVPLIGDAGETACEVDVSATAVTGGISLYSSLFSKSGSASESGGRDFSDIVIPPGAAISIFVTNLSGGNSTLHANARWKEEW